MKDYVDSYGVVWRPVHRTDVPGLVLEQRLYDGTYFLCMHEDEGGVDRTGPLNQRQVRAYVVLFQDDQIPAALLNV